MRTDTAAGEAVGGQSLGLPEILLLLSILPAAAIALLSSFPGAVVAEAVAVVLVVVVLVQVEPVLSSSSLIHQASD
jgi:hypothetical protein